MINCKNCYYTGRLFVIDGERLYRCNRYDQFVEATDFCSKGIFVEKTEEKTEPKAVKNAHGKWIHPKEYGVNLPEHYCSECGAWETGYKESDLCVNCGADMRKGEKNGLSD